VQIRAVVELGGKTATGIPVPEDVVTALGAGRRPRVTVTLGGHSFRTTIAPMSGRFFIPLSAENRSAAGVAAGDEVDVGIEVDTAPREVVVPADLRAALEADRVAAEAFDRLSYSHRKEWVRWVEEARKAETRERRIAKTVADVRDA